MKLTVQTFLTLDGVMRAPGGAQEDPSGDFVHGGWQAPFEDDAVGDFVVERNRHASAFLLGRRTFEIIRGHWPDQTDPGRSDRDGEQLAAQARRVRLARRRLLAWRAPRHRAARDRRLVTAIRALEDQPGDELQVWGSGNLLHTLLQQDLVDRFRLLTYPLVLGSGLRLFEDGIASHLPTAPSFMETGAMPTVKLVLDCIDPIALATFWAGALDYTVLGSVDNYTLLADAKGNGPQLLLQKVPEAKAAKNRMHLDIDAVDIAAEADRLEALGARRVESDVMCEHGSSWVLMADPEGNEFCVCDGGAASES